MSTVAAFAHAVMNARMDVCNVTAVNGNTLLQSSAIVMVAGTREGCIP